MVFNHQRPPEIEERRVPARMVEDVLKGQRGASAVSIQVERTTLFVTLAKTPGRIAADAIEDLSRRQRVTRRRSGDATLGLRK